MSISPPLTDFSTIKSGTGSTFGNTPFREWQNEMSMAGTANQIDAYNRASAYRREMGMMSADMQQPSQANGWQQALGGGLQLLKGVTGLMNQNQSQTQSSNPYLNPSSWNPSGIDWFSNDVPDLGFGTSLNFDSSVIPSTFDASGLWGGY